MTEKSSPQPDAGKAFEAWWYDRAVDNSGASIGADYKHWARMAWDAATLVAAPEVTTPAEPVGELQAYRNDDGWSTHWEFEPAAAHESDLERRVRFAVYLSPPMVEAVSSRAAHALVRCEVACERIVEQYGAVQCGVDFAALLALVRRGIAEEPTPAPCPRCGGSGEITVLSGGGPDAYDVPANCDHCGGSGALADAYAGLAKQLGDAKAESQRLSFAMAYGKGMTGAVAMDKAIAFVEQFEDVSLMHNQATPFDTEVDERALFVAECKLARAGLAFRDALTAAGVAK